MNPADLLQDLVVGDIGSQEVEQNFGSVTFGIVSQSNYVAQVGPGVPVNIILNDNAYGPWATSTSVEQAGTLLHELGHAFEQIFGASSTVIGNDSQNADPGYVMGTMNQTLVDTFCLAGLQ